MQMERMVVIRTIIINYQKEWKRNIQLVQYSTWIVTFVKRENFKIDFEDLFLLQYDLLKIRTKIKDFKYCANITKLNLSLSFQIITEDVQTLLEVVKMLWKQVCMK